MKVSIKKFFSAAALLLISSAAFASNATVISVTGKVEVNRNNVWVSVSADSQIAEGEVISTGFNSEALIRYNNSTMRLGPLTRITLEKLATSEKKDDVSVFVSTGAVRSSVKHTQNKRVTYTVRNPVAVASVRGTDFTFFGTGKTVCYEGAVALLPAAKFNSTLRGISKPADGLPPASPEEQTNAENIVPGDGNKPEDVNPFEKGGTLIKAGQSSEIDVKTGTPKQPQTFTAELHKQLAGNNPNPGMEPAEGPGNSGPDQPGKKNGNPQTTLNIQIKVSQ